MVKSVNGKDFKVMKMNVDFTYRCAWLSGVVYDGTTKQVLKFMACDYDENDIKETININKIQDELWADGVEGLLYHKGTDDYYVKEKNEWNIDHCILEWFDYAGEIYYDPTPSSIM